jgi:hypothetical protein
MHVALALGLVNWVTAVPFGCEPVVRHDDWQFAYVELQVIMQVVTAEVCANLIFPAADAPPPSPTMIAASNTYIDARIAIMQSLQLVAAAHNLI